MMTLVSRAKTFNGEVSYFQHKSSVNQCEMRFSVFLPSVSKSKKVPLLYWLSGLTCTEDNFTVKSGVQQFAEKYGIAVVAPDTSPRGEQVAKGDSWDLGLGAGFYVNATNEPWKKNYQMYDYVLKELPSLVESEFPVDRNRRGISGHSMGGHGALVLALRNPDFYHSVSAFAPIVAPTQCPWGEKAFSHYLGMEKEKWSHYDATQLVLSGKRQKLILVDQGLEDKFLKDQLMPSKFEEACMKMDQPLTLRYQDGYDHSYFFISTFMEDHIRHHAKLLA